MVEKTHNQNVFFIQIDASSYAEFEISEFEILRFDCILGKVTLYGLMAQFAPLFIY